MEEEEEVQRWGYREDLVRAEGQRVLPQRCRSGQTSWNGMDRFPSPGSQCESGYGERAEDGGMGRRQSYRLTCGALARDPADSSEGGKGRNV